MVRLRVSLVAVLVLIATVSTLGVGGAVHGTDGAAATSGPDGSSPQFGPGSLAVRPGLGGGASTNTPTPTPSRPSTDTTVTRLEVLANGSTRWTIEIRTRLETGDEADEFRAFQRAFRNDTDRFLGPFSDRMRSVVRNAENATGREMRAVDFQASTTVQEVPRRWGVVSYSFLWTGFAARDGDALVVGDVFEGGFFLATNDSMTVSAPGGYRIASVDPGPTDREGGRVTWNGREDFDSGRPRVRMVPGTPTPATSAGRGTGTASTPATGGGLPTWVPALALLLLVGAGGAALYVRRSDVDHGPGGGRATSDTATGGSDGQGGTGAPDAGSPGPDLGDSTPVLTDEERVERLLATGEGRMRQADVAEELDWSASKTSRVLSSMAEEGRIEKLQLGRENLIELPDEE